jgi:hypothetical protein
MAEGRFERAGVIQWWFDAALSDKLSSLSTAETRAADAAGA